MRLLQDPAFLSDMIGRVYDCALRPEGWTPLLAELAAQIGSRRASFNVSSAGGQLLILAAEHGVAADDPGSRYLPINPLLPFGLTWPLDKGMAVLRDYGAEAFRATRYYREYLAPQQINDAVVFLATREGGHFGSWILITHDDRGPITDAEVAGLELVAPHIRRAVEISTVLGEQRLAAESYRAALDQLQAAVLILDAEGRLSFANPAANALLDSGQPLRLLDGRLRGATEAGEQALRRALLAQGGLEVLLPGTDGAEHLLFAVSLATGSGGALGAAGRSTLLVLRAPRQESQNPVAIAARVFNLTPAQVQVLAFLAQGHAPEAIADIIGISATTVRSHLAEMFRRTGTGRQAELVARTLSLASPLRHGEAASGAA